MQDRIKDIKLRLNKLLFEVKNSEQFGQIRAQFFGKTGEISNLLKALGTVDKDDRAALGAKINELKTDAEQAVDSMEREIAKKELEEKLKKEKIDTTLDKKYEFEGGSIHPIFIELDKVQKILVGLGYRQVDDCEVEYDDLCFTQLNIPKDHPARDMQDTFFLNDELVLRTHTSPSQIKAMRKYGAPLKIFSSGRVFRIDDFDATHAPAFFQIEGLCVDKKLGMADLKKTLLAFLQKLLGEKTRIRFRSSFFPFTEPSVEVDASCNLCDGVGCPSCRGEGWIEMGGAGMVHPNVLKNGGINEKEYSGFAFGFGIDRLAKLAYKVADMRDFYTNDVRFLNQFGGKKI